MHLPSSDVIFLRPHSSMSLALQACGHQKATIEAWLRWWHEVSKTPYIVSEPTIAERKLSWWAKAVNLSFETPPQHPLLKAIAPGSDVLRAPPIDLWLTQLQALMELNAQTRWLDDVTLSRHIDASTGAACQSVAWLMGTREEATLQIARQLGQGLRRAHILSRLGQDAQKGWLHIPVDFLQTHGVKAHELLRPPPTPHPAHVINLLDAWQQDAKQRLLAGIDEARALPRQEKRLLKPLVVMSRLYLQLLDDLQKQRYPMLHQRVSVGPWRKLWTSRKISWTWL